MDTFIPFATRRIILKLKDNEFEVKVTNRKKQVRKKSQTGAGCTKKETENEKSRKK